MRSIKISDILNFLDAQKISYNYDGDRELAVNGFSSLLHYKVGTFTWIKKQANVPQSFDLSQITLAFVAEDVACADVKNVICTDESKRAFFSVIEKFFDNTEEDKESIGQFTYISSNVKIGKNVRIGHNCTLDGYITIGDGTVIKNNVSIINYCMIGKNCLLHSGIAIGTDGFGYSTDKNGVPVKVKHFGGVVIGDNTEIGANTCIDRGTLDNTVIGSNVKIDDLVMIGHNVEIEDNCMLTGGVMVGGSVKLLRKAYIGPGSIIKNQIKVGENSFVGMGTVVLKDVEKDSVVVGVPARELRKISKTDK